jgi:prophage regulatory protein
MFISNQNRTPKNAPQTLKRPDVLNDTSWSKSTLYNRIKAGLWPTSVSMGARVVGFVKTECEAIINPMIAEKIPEKIKPLVTQLVKPHKQAL